MVLSTVGAFPVSVLATQNEHNNNNESHKVNICHKDGDSGNWNALSVDENGWGGHSGHANDYLYAGPLDDGKPDNDDHKDDNWCKNHIPEPVDVCPNILGNQATIPSGYEKNQAGNCVPVPPVCDANSTQTIVSNETTTKIGSNYVVAVPLPYNAAWVSTTTLGVQSALWVWGEGAVVDPVNDTTETFTTTFNIVGTPKDSTIEIAADNSFSVSVNSDASVFADPSETNYGATKTYTIPASSLHTGLNTITFTIKNFHQDGGTQSTNPAGLLYKLVINSDDCQIPPPPPAPTATLEATKIVCDAETDLPNWGDRSGGDIDANTAATFLSTHPNCHRQSGWQFMWSLDGVGNPGDNNLSSSISGWNTFGLTDSNGSVATQIPSGAKVWVREVLQDGYIGFTGQNTNQNISAELYCNTDHLNYDNWDWIDPVMSSATYHCIAFNAPKMPTPPTECPLVDTPSSGWYSQYYNYKATDPFMQDGEVVWSTDRGNPSVSSSDSYQWYTPKFYKFNRVDSNLMFGANFYPFDVAPYNVAPYADSAQRIGGHEYHFGVHSSAKVIVPVTGNYAYTLSSDDDAWVLVDGVVVVDNHGIHAASTLNGTINMTAGTHIVDVYFAERHTVDSQLSFEFTDKSIAITPYSSLCSNTAPVCNVDQELVQNGSFEDPDISTGTFSIVPDSNPVLKWLVAWVSPLTNTGTLGLEIQDHVAGSPETSSGNQFAELDGYHPVNISQSITTVPGMNYVLSFKYSPRPGRNSADNAIQAQASGIVLGANITDDGSANSDTVWSTITRSFTATTTSTNIGFNDIGTDTSYGGYIDSVSLRCVPTTPVECPQGQHLSDNQCINDETPTDVCSNLEGNQATVPQGYHADGNQCIVDEQVVVDLCENIEGNQSVVPSGKHMVGDNQCVDDTNDSNPNPPTNPGGNGPVVGGFFGGGNGPIVLGASTNGQVLGDSCGLYMDKHIRFGSSRNNVEQVKKLQEFLNKWMGSKLPITGYYGPMTYAQVKAFQAKYGDDILKPWGLNEPTGLVYLATLRKINKLECPDLSLELPALVPWSQNPNAQ